MGERKTSCYAHGAAALLLLRRRKRKKKKKRRWVRPIASWRRRDRGGKGGAQAVVPWEKRGSAPSAAAKGRIDAVVR